jgi:amino acid adenylation domain-containing protein/non-ribosomal peptide synthase protein (TIGR01720 family)
MPVSTNELHSRNIQDIYTLTPLQEGMYFHALAEPASEAYISQLTYRISQPLQPALIERACLDLLNRHDILRTVFSHRKTDEVVQIVLKRRQPELHVEDLRQLASAEKEERIDAIREDDRKRGYDLSKDILLRLYVLRTGNEEYVLVWSHHHILMDGWCASMLLREFNELYSAHALARKPALRQAPPFSAFIRWLSAQDRAGAESFWRSYLEGCTETAKLPRSATAEQLPARFLELEVDFNLAGSNRIQKLAEDHRVTLHTIFQGVWSILLARYGGSDEVVFGTVTALRPPEVPDIERMIGLLINTLPVRIGIDESGSPQQLFAKLQEDALLALEHAHQPLASIQATAPQLQNLVDHLFITENFGDANANGQKDNGDTGLNASELGGFSQTNYDLNLILLPGASIRFRINFNANVFDEGMMRMLSTHFRFLLEQILSNPRVRISDLTLLQEEEVEELMEFGLGEAAGFSGTIPGLFQAQARISPDATVISMPDRQITYAELRKRSNAIAAEMKAAGVGPGACVGVLTGRRPELIESLLAITSLGAIYLPLEPGWPDARLGAIMKECGVNHLATITAFDGRLSHFTGCRLLLDRELPEATLEQDNSKPEDVAYIIFTSGSTGEPKGVPIRHESIASRILYHNQHLCFGSDDRMLQFAAANFDASLVEILMPLFCGGAVCLLPDAAKQELSGFLNFVEEHKVTAAILPPAFIRILDRRPLPTLKLLISTGEAAIREDLEAYARTMRVYNGYGPTEVCIGASFHQVQPDEPRTAAADLPIGKPFADTGIYILDRNLQLLPKGLTGEICVSGIGLTDGYLNHPELSRQSLVMAKFAPVRVYRTGDLGRWNEQGELEYLGRIDDQVQINGIRVEVGEVRECLNRIAGIRNAQVRPLRQGTQNILAAYFISDETVDTEALRLQLASQLPGYMVPRHFLQIDSFHLTPNGKIDWTQLPQPMVVEETGGTARNDREALLFEIVGSVLGRTVHANSDFFRTGGDSIKAIQVVSRLHRRGYELTVKDIFQEPVIGRLSAHLRTSSGMADQGPVTGTMPLTPIVAEFLQLPLSNPAHFNQGLLLQCSEPIQIKEAQAAVEMLFQHHDGLRLHLQQTPSGWQLVNEGPEQEVDFSVVDLSVENRPLEVCIESVQQSMDLQSGPLFKIRIFKTATGDRLLLLAHHLVVDGISWRILLEDLEALYHQAVAGKTLSLPPKTDSYRAWAEALSGYAKSTAIEPMLEYWKNADPIQKTLPLPARQERGEAVHSFQLNAEQTQSLLEEANAAFHTETGDILLAALGLAADQHLSLPQLPLTLEGHGREPFLPGLDVSRTVGWFTSLYPLVMPTVSNDIAGYLQAVKERIRSVPDRGIGWGICRHLSAEGEVLANQTSTILFNYLGQFQGKEGGSFFSEAPEGAGQMTDPDAMPIYPLVVSAKVVEGRLSVSMRFDRRCFEPTSAERLCEGYQRQLVRLIDRCLEQPVSRLTPADTDFPQMGIDELNELQRECESKYGSGLEALYPLTPMQEGLLFHCLAEPESQAYIYQVRYGVEGNLQPHILHDSVQHLVARHPALRTVFRINSVPLSQMVLRTKHAPVRWIDLRQMNGHGESQVDQFLHKDAAEGFQLQTDTLIRLTVFQHDESKFSLVWTSHHLVLDGWCLNILLDEFAKIYKALSHGTQPLLPSAAPYRNYVRWVRERPGSGLAYWLDHLDGYDTTVSLPVRRELPERHEKLPVQLNSPALHQLNEAAQALRVTLSTLVHTAWGLLLARYNDVRDVVFGSVSAGRPPAVAGIETMIGLFINTVPVRVRFESDALFGNLARAVQSDMLNAELHQYCSLAQIQSALGREQPLTEFVFDFTNYPAPGSDSATGSKQPWKLVHAEARERTNYAFFISASARETLDITFHYDTGTYSGALVRRLAEHFVFLLEQIAKDKWISVRDLKLSRNAEAAALQSFSHGSSKSYPLDKSYSELFRAQATAVPEAVCVYDTDGNWTYEEVDAWSSALAVRMKEFGLNRGGVVATGIERGAMLISSILAIWKAGGIYLPIHAALPNERVAMLLEQAGAVLVLDSSTREWPGEIPLLRPERQINSTDKYNAADAGRGNDAAYLLYTSGSTGAPKGALVEHRGLLNHLFSRVDRYGLAPDIRVAQTASQSFDISIWQMMAPLLAGASVVVYPQEKQLAVPEFLQALRSDRIGVLQLVPSFATQFLDTITTLSLDVQLPDLQTSILVGEELKPALAGKWHSTFPGKVLINTYGPTEAADTIADFTIDPENIPDRVPVGRPIENTRLYVLDRDGRHCPPDVTGEIFVSGPGVGPGYLNAPDKTAALFREDPNYPGDRMYATGDLGSWSESGVLHYHGRRDHQVKINGHRIELGEIETALQACEGVVQAIAIHFNGVEPGSWKGIAAYVLMREGMSTDNLLPRLRELLPAYSLPSSIIQLNSFPVNLNGKIDRKRLPAPVSAKPPEADETAISPQEQLLLDIWRQVLGQQSINSDDHFIEAGGDSIRAMQVSARCFAAGYRLDLKSIFEFPTIALLAPQLLQLEPEAEEETDGPMPLTPIQARFFSLPFETPQQYNQAFLFDLPQRLQPAAIQGMFDCLLRHHDVLRARFPYADGRRTMVVEPEAEAAVSCLDWRNRHVSREDLESKMQELQTGFNLEAGPLFRAALFSLADSDKLFVVAHHLVIDGVSWRILHEDLNQLIRLYREGRVLQLPRKTTSFRQWTLALTARRNSDELRNERAYWSGLLSEEYPSLPFANRNVVPRCFSRCGFRWNREQSARFLQSGTAHAPELLLSAFVIALSREFDVDRVLVDVETHGRESLPDVVNLSRTVGWFTSLHPVAFHRTRNPKEQIDAVRRSLKAAPSNGLGYGLLRFLPDANGRIESFGQQSHILFNYLGQFDSRPDEGGLVMTSEGTGDTMGREEIRSHAWNASGFVADGCLSMSVDYCNSFINAERMASFAAAWDLALDELLDEKQESQPEGQEPEAEFASLSHEELNYLNHLFNPQT